MNNACEPRSAREGRGRDQERSEIVFSGSGSCRVRPSSELRIWARALAHVALDGWVTPWGWPGVRNCGGRARARATCAPPCSIASARNAGKEPEHTLHQRRLHGLQMQVLARVFDGRGLERVEKITRQRHLERAGHRGIRRHRRTTQVTNSALNLRDEAVSEVC